METDRQELPAGAMFHENIADTWSHGYSRQGFGKRLGCFASILDRQVVPGARWLDLGCGSGVLTGELLKRGASVLAVDGSPAMLREAQLHVARTGHSGATWLQSDVERMDGIRGCTFDGILCSSVIEYVERPQALLDEACRTLVPGGRLVISIPPKHSFVRTVQKMARRVAGIFGVNKFAYLSVSKFEIALGELEQKFNSAGFAVDKVTPFDPKLPSVALSVLRPALLIVEAQKKSEQ